MFTDDNINENVVSLADLGRYSPSYTTISLWHVYGDPITIKLHHRLKNWHRILSYKNVLVLRCNSDHENTYPVTKT